SVCRRPLMPANTLYHAGQSTVNAAAHLLFNMDVAWQAPLPDGPKIISPNHPSTIDPVVLVGLMPERLHILIDDRLFKVPALGRYLHAVGHVPVVPARGRDAFDAVLELLADGATVAVFPEGQISPLTGGSHPAQTGAARLALLTGAPIIPVGIHLDRSRIRLTETMIDGAAAVGTWYTGGPYGVTVGESLHLTGAVQDWDQVRAESDRVMGRINALAAQSERRMLAAHATPTKPAQAIQEYSHEIWQIMRGTLVYARFAWQWPPVNVRQWAEGWTARRLADRLSR
ncbi:lysophospholipid acyltransferase family protein, partial [Chloroflexota bacterium]